MRSDFRNSSSDARQINLLGLVREFSQTRIAAVDVGVESSVSSGNSSSRSRFRVNCMSALVASVR